jgi:hypothetical protein
MRQERTVQATIFEVFAQHEIGCELRFELASGCTFDLWADDVPTCPVEIRTGGEIWVKPVFSYADPVGHWRQRLADGLAHGARRVAADCDGAAPSQARSPLASRPDLATLKGWLQRGIR